MKVIFDLAGGKLAIEGDGSDLLQILAAAKDLAPNVSQIQIITSSGNSPSNPPPKTEESGGTGVAITGTLRQFARSLSLDNTSERIAAIAYYVNKIESRPSFAPKEMDGWFTMCGFQKPSQMPLALYDARRKYGYMENVSRGSWRISNQGENLIIRKCEEVEESR